MLVLSRKKGETVAIADGEVIVTVVEIRGDKVRLGFSADKDIPIHRGEVHNARVAQGELKAEPVPNSFSDLHEGRKS